MPIDGGEPLAVAGEVDAGRRGGAAGGGRAPSRRRRRTRQPIEAMAGPCCVAKAAAWVSVSRFTRRAMSCWR
jgi:hypothetical protein